MTALTHRPLAFVLGLAVAACQAAPSPTGPTPSPAPGSSATPGETVPAATPGASAAYISGEGDLFLDPMEGLAALGSHTSTLTWSFEGTTNGQPGTWTETTSLRLGKDPVVAEVLVERTNVPGAPARTWQALVGGVVYETAEDGSCAAGLPDAGANPFDEPARGLSALIGGTETGTETINGIAAKAFQFDGLAMGFVDPVKATGHAWISPSDELLLRYDVAIDAGPEFLGDGITGRLTGTYELRDIGSAVDIAIPGACPAGLIEGPQPTDATEVESLPGLLSLRTGMTVAAAMAFYRDTSLAFGWTASGEPKIQSEPGVAALAFTNGELSITVLILEQNGGSQVVVAAQRA